MKRIARSCAWSAGGLTAFCLWLTALVPAAAQDAAQLQAELDKSRAVIQRLQAERAAMQDELAKVRAVAQDQAAQLRAELEQSRVTVKLLQVELTRLKQLAIEDEDARQRLERVIAAQAGKLPDGKPLPKPEDLPPKVNGVIRAIQGEMIEISLGSDDGLKKGHRLDVYRIVNDQGIYVGRIELIKTGATESVGRMLSEVKKKEPQKGDRVATRM
jgi:TolA-binding protein